MDRISVKLTMEECDLILNQTFAGEDLSERLREARAGEKYIMVAYTLDELNDLAEFIAAEANHVENKKLEKRLEALYDKISDIENKYL